MPRGWEIAGAINRLLSMPFALKVATRDWHPKDHISFNTSNEPPNNKAFESSTTIANPQNATESTTIPVWPVHCMQGTPGAEIISEINTARIDRIVDKGRDSRVEMFSAFADAFGNKSEAASFDLAAWLKESGISRVFIVGVAGDYCVRYTAIDAKKEGFNVYVVLEGVKSIDKGQQGWGATVRQFKEEGIKLVSIVGDEVQAIDSSS